MAFSINLIDTIQTGAIKIVKLSETTVIKPFDCGIPDLNNFLFEDANPRSAQSLPNVVNLRKFCAFASLRTK
jgi:hypothetical protein